MPMAINHTAHPTSGRASGGALIALVAVRAALRILGFDHAQRLTRRLVRSRRVADPARISRALAAVDTASAWVPFRVACLERSLAAQLLLLTRRYAAEWHVGVRPHPLAMHAWLADSSGHAIGEPDAAGEYQSLVVIGPDHRPGDTP